MNLERNPPTAVQKLWIIQQMEITEETSYSMARKLNCRAAYIRKLTFRHRKNHQFRDMVGRPTKASNNLAGTVSNNQAGPGALLSNERESDSMFFSALDAITFDEKPSSKHQTELRTRAWKRTLEMLSDNQANHIVNPGEKRPSIQLSHPDVPWSIFGDDEGDDEASQTTGSTSRYSSEKLMGHCPSQPPSHSASACITAEEYQHHAVAAAAVQRVLSQVYTQETVAANASSINSHTTNSWSSLV